MQAAVGYNPLMHRRDRSNSANDDDDVMDLSYMDLEGFSLDIHLTKSSSQSLIRSLLISNNLLSVLPSSLRQFQNLQVLDISSNQLKTLDLNIRLDLPQLTQLIAKENLLSDNSLPKDFDNGLLEVVNFSGNQFTQFPYQLLSINSLKEIYLGSNRIKVLPRDYPDLSSLQILYLGGNRIKRIPDELSQLVSLTNLNLSDNVLTILPAALARMKKLTTLSLHGNQLTTLPVELVRLDLHELSLRNNPLVNRFANEFSYEVPSLLELSARLIKTKKLTVTPNQLPAHLESYLNSATCCLNPKCSGVYFTSKVEHVKFVDFCGRYRIPLMQYLCSSICNEKIVNRRKVHGNNSDSDTDLNLDENSKRLKKILLG